MNVNVNFAVDLAVLVMVMLLLPVLFQVLCWVLRSVSLYAIAKRRGIHHAWLGWIPVGDMWIWGSISDQYRYVVRGENRSRRKLLLALSAVTTALSWTVAVLYIKLVMELAMYGDAYLARMPEEEVLHLVASPMVSILGLVMVNAVCAIVQVVFQYITLSDIYMSCKPQSHVLYLVLSILLGVTLPFFLFASRKYDGGMPPRRMAPQPNQYVPYTPVPQTPPVAPAAPVEPAVPTPPAEPYRANTVNPAEAQPWENQE